MKLYVSYNTWKVLVTVPVKLTRPGHYIQAICEALSYMGFKDSTEIPAKLLCWDSFLVDERGFRDFDTADHETVIVDVDEALDWFDELNRKYDPFCEDGK